MKNALLIRSLVTFLVLGATAPLMGQDGAAAVQAGDVFLGGSRVYTHVYKKGLGHEHAVIGKLASGFLSLNGQPRPNQGMGELVFDIQSFVADTESARKYIGLEGTTDADTAKQVTTNMLSAEVLDAVKHPTATYKVSSIKESAAKSAKGLKQYEFNGEFTLHGVTRPLQLVAEAEYKDGWVHLVTKFTVLQTQFGIRPYRKAFGAVGVADNLDIYGDLWVAPNTMAVQR